MSETVEAASIGEDFPRQQERVRELLTQYEAIGPPGMFGALMIRQALSRAERAMASGDIVAILTSYSELKGFE